MTTTTARRWTRQDALDAILEFAAIDPACSISGYRAWARGSRPSINAIRGHFGRWNDAKTTAGLSVCVSDPPLPALAVDYSARLDAWLAGDHRTSPPGLRA